MLLAHHPAHVTNLAHLPLTSLPGNCKKAVMDKIRFILTGDHMYDGASIISTHTRTWCQAWLSENGPHIVGAILAGLS